jgi:hypothetical protein
MRASQLLQRALYAALTGDAALRSRAVEVFDGPPPDSRPPYLTIGIDQVRPWRWKDGGGHEHRFQVGAWDKRSEAMPLKVLMADVERVVLSMPRRFEGMRIVTLTLVSAQTRPNPKAWIQGVLEFRALCVMEN